ncbi:MAG TPA: GNAT family N-acetyltransferase [Rectinemataceae bacterium]
MYSISLFIMADYRSVLDLWLHTPGMGLNNLDDSEEGIRAYLARNPNTCFVAKDEDEVVGVILAGHDGRRGFIYHLAVRPEAREGSDDGIESSCIWVYPWWGAFPVFVTVYIPFFLMANFAYDWKQAAQRRVIGSLVGADALAMILFAGILAWI